MRIRATIVAAVAALLLLAPPAGAQSPARFRGHLGALVGLPDGGFGRWVDGAVGAGAGVRLRLDPGDHLALRLDGQWLAHDWDRRGVDLRSPLGGLTRVDLTTAHTLGFVQLGPELSAALGRARAYLGAGAGIAQFLTSASAQDQDGDVGFSTEVHQQDFAVAYGGRAGVRIPTRVLRTRLDVDLGLGYSRSGRAELLRKEDVTVTDDGSLNFAPVRVRAGLWIARIGVSIPFGSERRARDEDAPARGVRAIAGGAVSPAAAGS